MKQLTPRQKYTQKRRKYARRKKRNLIAARGNYCEYCLTPGSAECIDHYVPIAKGGSNHRDNLRLSCVPCNKLKGDMMPEEFMNKYHLGPDKKADDPKVFISRSINGCQNMQQLMSCREWIKRIPHLNDLEKDDFQLQISFKRNAILQNLTVEMRKAVRGIAKALIDEK